MNKALFTIKQIQIINKKDFVIVALDINSKLFVVYIIIKKQKEIIIYSNQKTQIKIQNQTKTYNKSLVRALLFDKVFKIVLIKYFDYNYIILV